MDGKVIQLTFVSDRTYSDLHNYLDDLPTKLVTTFRTMFDSIQDSNFLVAVYVPYINSTKE